jgi:hypothetical protein
MSQGMPSFKREEESIQGGYGMTTTASSRTYMDLKKGGRVGNPSAFQEFRTQIRFFTSPDTP